MVKMEMVICQSELCFIQHCSPVIISMVFLILGGPEHLIFEQLWMESQEKELGLLQCGGLVFKDSRACPIRQFLDG